MTTATSYNLASNTMSGIKNCCNIGTAAPESYMPGGIFETVESLPVYTTFPPVTSKPHGLLLVLPDGFGHAKHNLMLADKFASDGWRTFLPDYFLGDALSERLLDRKHAASHSSHEETEITRSFNFPEWLENHPHHQVDELLRRLIEWLQKSYSNQPIFAIGYCFGGKHAFRLAKWAVKAAAAFHPSFLVASDAVNVVSPLYIGLAEKDTMVSESLEKDLREWLEEGKVNFTLKNYPDVDHGFASRPNPYDARAAEEFSNAYQDAMAFFQKHT